MFLGFGTIGSGLPPSVPTLTAPTSTSPSSNGNLVRGDPNLALAATGDVGLTSMSWIAYKQGETPAHASAITLGTDTDGGDANYAATDASFDPDIDTHGTAWSIIARATNGVGSTDSTALNLTVTHPHLHSELFIPTGSATHTTNANVIEPGLVARNKGFVECWGSGGGSLADTGSGGGGAYAATPDYALSASTGYSYTVPAGGAADTNGSDATWATTGVVAKAGLSRTNGGTGGTAAASTGTTKFSGGDGSAGTGNQNAGAGAGADGAASGSTPGEPQGGFGRNTAGREIGAGGGSTTTLSLAGANGRVRVTYEIAATAGFPRIRARKVTRINTDATSHVITMPSGIVSGERLLAIVVADGVPSVSASGWTVAGQHNEATSQVKVAVLHKSAAGSDTLTVDLTVSERVTVCVMRVAGGGTPEVSFSDASASNADSPNHNSAGGSVKGLWLTAIGMDTNSSVGNFVQNKPANYNATIDTGEVSTTGVRLFIAERLLEASAEDPAAWATASEQYVGATILVPP